MLLTSNVPRALETKTKLLGFELSDLLLIFVYLALSNLAFGPTRMKLPMVWVGTPIIAGVLFFSKRNKPENHLQHLGEFYRVPGTLSAGSPDLEYEPYFKFLMEDSDE